jgi:hypothetical protein
MEEYLVLQTQPRKALITKNQPQYGLNLPVITDGKAAAKNVSQGIKP